MTVHLDVNTNTIHATVIHSTISLHHHTHTSLITTTTNSSLTELRNLSTRMKASLVLGRKLFNNTQYEISM